MTNALIGGLAALSLLVQGEAARKSQGGVPAAYSTLFSVGLADGTLVRDGLLRSGRELASPAMLQAERGPCNMPVVRGTADVDPKAIVPIDRQRVDHRIRAIEPPACWESARETDR